jgi:hypothetical protein
MGTIQLLLQRQADLPAKRLQPRIASRQRQFRSAILRE